MNTLISQTKFLIWIKRLKFFKMEKEKETPRCSECGSTQVYLRLKTKERYCRTCGYIEDLEIKKDKKGE